MIRSSDTLLTKGSKVPNHPSKDRVGRRETFELHAALLGELLLLPAKAQPHRLLIQLVAHHGAHPHQLLRVPQQLPEIAFRLRRIKDAGKAIGKQKIENESGPSTIGFLLMQGAGGNLCAVSDLQLVTEFRP